LVLEGYRQAAISLFNELSAFSGTQEFLAVVRSLPRDRSKARAPLGVGLLASPLPFLTCGIFAYVIARLGLNSVAGAVKPAVAV
jgi:hypothetical protein